jgi:YfiH family protein
MGIVTVDWPAPAGVRACYTTRSGGASVGEYREFNLATHVGDDAAAVTRNRRQLQTALELPQEPLWLNQTHSTTVVDAADYYPGVEADACYSRTPGKVCVVMTADCLPLLITNQTGTEVAAVHAGWRGLVNGAIENTLRKFQAPAAELGVWLGPAIGPQHFEVGPEVKQQFCAQDPQAEQAFVPGTNSGKYMADIYQLARQRLNRQGVTRIYGGDFCTYSENDRFYSFRRHATTGRMASLIWFEK